VTLRNNQVRTENGILTPEKNLGVLLGPGDNIQEIIINVGYGDFLDTLTTNDFDDLNTLLNYSIIFIASSSPTIDFFQQKNLSDYLFSGGNVYASDSAALDFCDLLMELGIKSCGGDDFIGSPQTINAQVPNSSLEVFLGSNQAPVKYIAPSWFSINDTVKSYPTLNVYTTGTYFTRQYQDTVTDGVLSFNIDLNPNSPGGNLIYTTFRNEPNQNAADVLSILKFYIFEM
jgi:hypothetical protein